MRLLPKSLFWRIQLWYAFLLLLIVGGLVTGFIQYEKKRLEGEIRDQLRDRSIELLPLFFSPHNLPERGRGRSNRHHEKRGVFQEDSTGKREQVLTQLEGDGVSLLINKRGEQIYKSTSFPPLDLIWIKGNKILEQRQEGYLCIHITGKHEDSITLVGNLESVRHLVRAFASRWILLGLGVIGAALIIGGSVLRYSLRPIFNIKEISGRIARGDLSARIHATEKGSELGGLSDDLDHAFARLEASFLRQRQFTSDASHELRTPLTIILTKTQWALRKEREIGQYQAALKTALHAARRMKYLTEDLLSLARFDSGDDNLYKEEVDLMVLVRTNIALIKTLADEKGVRVKAEAVSIVTKVDKGLMNQVLTNLIGNAVKYTEGGGEILVKLTRHEQEIHLEVNDTGIGIPEEELDQVFERFYQADSSRTEGSSGLGLAITKRIIEKHGGHISVKSKLGQGSVFKVRLKDMIS